LCRSYACYCRCIKNNLNGDNKVAKAKEAAKRALASYSNLNNAQSTADFVPQLRLLLSLHCQFDLLLQLIARYSSYYMKLTEGITNANGSNADEAQVQTALNQLNQAKNNLNGVVSDDLRQCN
jgi:hypothetical protein